MIALSVYPFLDLLAVTTMALATCVPAGEPHAAPLYFVSAPELRFYLFSDDESQHTSDLAADAGAKHE